MSAVSRQKTRYNSLADYMRAEEQTLAHLSAEVGVSIPYLSDIKRGAKTPSLPVALRIAAHCGIPLESLVGKSEAA